MAIVRERPSQRLHHRVDAPLRVVVEGQTYETIDWSLGGCCIQRSPEGIGVNDTRTITLNIPFQGFEITFNVEAAVVRVWDGQIAFRYAALDDRQKSLLEHFIEDLLRGSMSVAKDTIRRIDTPVTPISTKPDPNPLSETPVQRIPVGRLLKTVAYLALGLVVFGYAAFTIYMNVMKMEVRTAVVSAPIQTVLASTSGIIRALEVEAGQRAREGELMMLIEDANLEEAIERAEIKISAAELELEAEADALVRAEYRLQMHRQEARRELRSAEVTVTEQTALAKTSAAAADRWRTLFKKGLVTRTKLDEADAAAARDRAALARAKETLASATAALRAIDSGRYFDGRDYRDEIVEIEGRVERARRRIDLVTREREALKGQRARISVRAPSTGTLVKLFKSVGSGVKRGEPIGLFEADQQRGIEAYLTQDEASGIRTGGIVSVRFPGININARAIVVGIDRTDSFIDPVQGRYTWLSPDARTARVTLKPATEADARLMSSVSPGTPVTVLFDRDNLANRLLDAADTSAFAAGVGQ